MSKEFKDIDRVLNAFKEIDPYMQIVTVQVLLEIAKAEEFNTLINVGDIAQRLSLKSSVASRNISYWAMGNSSMKGAFEFVSITDNPKDRRSKILRLTKAGHKFISKIFGE